MWFQRKTLVFPTHYPLLRQVLCGIGLCIGPASNGAAWINWLSCVLALMRKGGSLSRLTWEQESRARTAHVRTPADKLTQILLISYHLHLLYGTHKHARAHAHTHSFCLFSFPCCCLFHRTGRYMANWQVLCSMVLWLNKQTRCCQTICGNIIANLDNFIWQRLYICLMQYCLLLWWFIFVMDQRINMMGGIVDRNINTMNTPATV